MKHLNIIIIILGVHCAPRNYFAQSKNTIVLQTGLFHLFFDKSPIINTDYPNKAKKPFNGLLINSLGIQYGRKLNDKNGLSFSFDSFREEYDKHSNLYPIFEPIVFQRLFLTLNANYYKIQDLNSEFSFLYGIGINFRTGSESIIVARGIIGELNGEPIYEILLENIRRNDFGLNTFIGINYTPIKWLTISTKLDFLSSIILNDQNGKQKMKEVYNSSQFPSRYDLSLNFGIGFNF